MLRARVVMYGPNPGLAMSWLRPKVGSAAVVTPISQAEFDDSPEYPIYETSVADAAPGQGLGVLE
jgi:hypothetical protein